MWYNPVLIPRQSILSTTFFDFHDAGTLSSAVSPTFWLYWSIVIPLTTAVVLAWYIWERQRKKRVHEVALELMEQGMDVEDMEKEIMANMRKRTLSKIATRNAASGMTHL